MPDQPGLLGPGPLPLVGTDVHIVGPVGRVGDGLVYVARDGVRPARIREYAPPGVARRVADGTLHSADAGLEQAWQEGTARFLEQGHRLAGIDHFGVAPVWRAVAVEADGVRQGAYLIGSPVGESLGAALGAGLQLTPAQVMRIARELTDTLADIHERGLTHLDVSPDTVSIAAGYVELTDFAVDNRPFMALLQSQEGLVRPGYSPIEHYDASMAEPLGPPADVYAGSALLFRLITGRDPAPWQERWRDPSSSQLADRDAYPAEFIEAVRKGLAIEPEDRFPHAGAWRAAMGFAAADPLDVRPALGRTAPTVIAAGAAAPPSGPPHVPPQRNAALAWLVPLLFLAGIVLIAAGGYLAYKQRWFVPADEETGLANRLAARDEVAPRPQRPRSPAALPIEPGATVSGRLVEGDRERSGGQYEDRFVLEGRAGDRIELRLSSGQFDPVLNVSGPRFSASNDDDEESGTRNSRLVLTLPRNGSYTISASATESGASGDYLLELERRPSEITVAAPAMLAGRWRRSEEPNCATPLLITLEGDALVLEQGGKRSSEQILDGIGRTIRTRIEGEERGYLLSEDGDRFEHAGELWVRC